MKTVDEEITRRAKARLQAKIVRFKNQISDAIRELDPYMRGMCGPYASDRGKNLLAALNTDAWPAYLLQKEHEAELDKLFAAIDAKGGAA